MSMNDERASVEGDAPSLSELTEEQEAQLEARNGLIQASAMIGAIDFACVHPP